MVGKTVESYKRDRQGQKQTETDRKLRRPINQLGDYSAITPVPILIPKERPAPRSPSGAFTWSTGGVLVLVGHCPRNKWPTLLSGARETTGPERYEGEWTGNQGGDRVLKRETHGAAIELPSINNEGDAPDVH